MFLLAGVQPAKWPGVAAGDRSRPMTSVKRSSDMMSSQRSGSARDGAHEPGALQCRRGLPKSAVKRKDLAVGWPVMAFTRITVRADQMDGVPCIRGLRIPVATIVGMIADGMSTDELLEAYPALEQEDIHEALRYAAEAVRERGLPLAG